MDKPQVLVHVEHRLTPGTTYYDTRWIPRSSRFVAVGNNVRQEGAIAVYRVQVGSGNDDGATTVQEQAAISLPHPVKCATLGAGGTSSNRLLATGDFKGQLHVWDVDGGLEEQRALYSTPAHASIINAIDGARDAGAPEIVTGSRDGAVKVWDVRQKDEPVAVMAPLEAEAKRDCWTVAFGDSHASERCICAGYDNGDIKMFDLRAMSLRWEANLGNGVCCVEFDRKDVSMNKLVATALEAKFHVYDLRTQHPLKGFAYLVQTTQRSTVWLVRHLPQNRDVFATTTGNGHVAVWKYNYPEKRSQTEAADGKLSGVVGSVTALQSAAITTQPVLGFDWNRDLKGLAVCNALDEKLRILLVTRLNTVD